MIMCSVVPVDNFVIKASVFSDPLDLDTNISATYPVYFTSHSGSGNGKPDDVFWKQIVFDLSCYDTYFLRIM